MLKFIKIIVISFLLILSSCKEELSSYNNDYSSSSRTTGRVYEYNYDNGTNAEYAQKDEFKQKLKKDNKNKAKILLITPKSGEYKKLGNAVFNAVTSAVIEKNDKKFLVTPIDENSSDLANQVDKQLQAGNVKAVIGPVFYNNFQYIENTLREYNLPVFSLSNNYNITGDNFFVTGQSPTDKLQVLQKYFDTRKYNFVTILVPNSEFGDRLAQNFDNFYSSHFSDTNFQIISYDNNREKIFDSLKPFSEKLKKDREENEEFHKQKKSLIVVEENKNMEKIVEGLRDNGLLSMGLKIATLSSYEDLSKFSRIHLNKGIFIGFYGNSYNEFKSKFKKSYKYSPPTIATISYDLTNLIYRNLLENDYNINQSNFHNNDSFAGASGSFKFDSNNLIKRDVTIIEINNEKATKLSTIKIDS